MSIPIIVSYYTEGDRNNFYSKCFTELKKQCEQFSFLHYFEKKNSLKDYHKNCKQKPKFILECLEKFNNPVLFIDIDCILSGNIPVSFLNLINYDIAVAKTDGLVNDNEKECSLLSNYNCGDPKSIHIRDGLIFANNTIQAKQFIEQWDSMCHNTNMSDHMCLDCLVKKNVKQINVKILPAIANTVFNKTINKNNIINHKETFCFYRVSSGHQNLRLE